jgi:hypothetical protein
VGKRGCGAHGWKTRPGGAPPIPPPCSSATQSGCGLGARFSQSGAAGAALVARGHSASRPSGADRLQRRCCGQEGARRPGQLVGRIPGPHYPAVLRRLPTDARDRADRAAGTCAHAPRQGATLTERGAPQVERRGAGRPRGPSAAALLHASQECPRPSRGEARRFHKPRASWRGRGMTPAPPVSIHGGALP